MAKDRLSPLVLLAAATGFTVWSAVLVLSPGGSKLLELLQLVVSIAMTGYGMWAYRRNEPVHNRRSRYLLLTFAVFGVIVVLGLAADQRSSRTWARLGWAAFIVGYVGSIAAWWPHRQHRMATIVMSIAGAFLVIAGFGLTLSCDRTVQRTWCDPTYEREQAIAETIEVDGQFERAGRASGSLGAALVTHFIPDGAKIPNVTHPPGEWDYEERPLQSIEVQRGRYTTQDEEDADCRLDVKVEVVPAGNRQTIYVTCGVEV